MSCIICTWPLCNYAGKQRLAEAGLLLRRLQARQVVQEGSCSFVMQCGVQRLEVVYLGGFCFACAGWARGGSPQLKVQGRSECDVAAICHGGHNQPPLGPHILVPIDEPDKAHTAAVAVYLILSKGGMLPEHACGCSSDSSASALLSSKQGIRLPPCKDTQCDKMHACFTVF